MTDSSTGGYLAPSSAAPTEDAALDALLQSIVVGITGLSGTLVRPRWQPVVPKQPEPTVDWCAIGVVDEDQDYSAANIHNGAANSGNGQDTQYRHTRLHVLASLFGPNCRGNARLLSDGIQIPQNREAMLNNQIAFVYSTGPIMAPSLVNDQWLKRTDLHLYFTQMTTRIYPVLNILEAVGTANADLPGSDGTPPATESWIAT